MVTIYHVAKDAGCSIATVSRVLNNGRVKAQTRESVERAVRKLGYAPDSRATFLGKKKSAKIGAIIPDISNPFYPIGIKTIHDLVRANGYELILGNTYGHVDEEKSILEMMERERAAGIIVCTCEGEDDSELRPVFERLLKHKTHLVYIGKDRNGLQVDTVLLNNFSGTFKATDYLVRTGRKKIGFIAGKRGLKATEERLAGCTAALKKNRIKTPSDLLICEGEYTAEYGERWGEVLLREHSVDAVVCGNDLMAIGVFRAAEKLKRKIPRDVAVIGFDDIYLASVVTPKLTTVRQDIEKTWTIASRFLFERIRGVMTGAPKEIVLEPDLIARESA